MSTALDHEARREMVAQVAARLLVNEGAEALTIRGVAKAAGYSTAVVSYYFQDKRDLLIFTYRHLVAQAPSHPRPPGGWTARAIREELEYRLPTTDFARNFWRAWFAFFAINLQDPEFAAEQALVLRDRHERGAQRFREAFGVSDAEAQRLGRLTLTVTMGLAAEICFDGHKSTTPEAVRELIDQTLAAALPMLPRLAR